MELLGRYMKKLYLIPILIFCLGAAPTRTKPYNDGDVIRSEDVTENEDNIFSYLQAGVDTYRADTITEAAIADGAVTTDQILNLTIVANDIAVGAVTTSKVLDNDLTATDLAATLTFIDGDFINMSAVNPGSTTEGLIIPQGTSCASATAAGQLCVDTDDGVLYVGGNDVPTPGTPAVVLGTAAAEGSALTTLRTDATIVAFNDGADPEQMGATADPGDDAFAARRDHIHAQSIQYKSFNTTYDPAAGAERFLSIGSTTTKRLIFIGAHLTWTTNGDGSGTNVRIRVTLDDDSTEIITAAKDVTTNQTVEVTPVGLEDGQDPIPDLDGQYIKEIEVGYGAGAVGTDFNFTLIHVLVLEI